VEIRLGNLGYDMLKYSNMNRSQVIAIVLFILIIIGAFFYFFIMKQEKEKKEISIPSVDPMENFPTANPFENTKYNPLEDIYKNPFE
jgi:flagellar basal body-associated protein FliL